MSKLKYLIRQSFTNPAILYVISRYATYIIQFINSLFIAIYLGPYYLGIWGFINLVLGYISQVNFGIPYSINVIVSVNKEKEDYVLRIIGNGLSMVVGLTLILIIFFIVSSLGSSFFGEKYEFNSFVIPVGLIAILTHFNNLFSNIFRIYKKILAIALNQSLYPILTILIIPFFKGSELLWGMIITYCITVIISFILFIITTPIKLKLYLDFKLIKYIQKRGWHLFVYNASFYLILLSTKAIISWNYRVEEFGFFTFSYSLANAILLLLNSISYLIFPKLLNRFANSDNDQVNTILGGLRSAYISLAHLLIHFVIMLFPLFILLFQDYYSASKVFKLTALTVVIMSNSFGYSGLLMARGKEKVLSFSALCALILNIILVEFFVYILKVEYSKVILGTLITYFIYIIFLGFLGRRELLLRTTISEIINDIFPIRMLVPFFLSLILILFSAENVYFIIPFIVYILMNLKDISKLKHVGLKVVNNPNFINI